MVFLYVLASRARPGRSYVGVSNDTDKRLRQHNGEITGGARYTRRYRPWRVFARFRIHSRRAALPLEYRVKRPYATSDGTGPKGRVAAVRRVLARLFPPRG